MIFRTFSKFWVFFRPGGSPAASAGAGSEPLGAGSKPLGFQARFLKDFGLPPGLFREPLDKHFGNFGALCATFYEM